MIQICPLDLEDKTQSPTFNPFSAEMHVPGEKPNNFEEEGGNWNFFM